VDQATTFVILGSIVIPLNSRVSVLQQL